MSNSERLVPLLLLPLLAACEIEKVSIPQTQSRLATHAVLSVTAPTQVVLLERTRTGAVSVVAPPFELEDPLGSDAGIAESGATITLTAPDGQVFVAREDVVVFGNNVGRGVYRFILSGDALERRATYKLSVLTLDGEVLSAETAVPEGTPAMVAEDRDFDRSKDSLVVAWPAAAGARSYFVRIETPYGPRTFFTDSTRVRLTGDLRNVNVSSLPHVFFPGFPQIVTVSAVDSNYYDWYRSHNDEISGTGLVNRVQGGLGVFGSLVRLRFENVRVVAPQRDPAEGKFVFVGTPDEQISTPYLALELYVESRATRSDQPDAVSGRYDRNFGLGDVGCATCGLLGTTRNGRIQLALLREWSARDTAEVLTGEFHGDTIVGSYRGHSGIARFVRKR